ncbi:hypothetical protein DFP93_102410 [Aneurinibacillus soli]|uniref:Uncharacterized protein n=1 Tax=Aneurinibacillus soli TaxID=1500254 RepID=A0A0U5AYK4_9BACL|nr:hypothetical protein [Aneurinibacillus soli]PYE63721.1 hypothetical protein DFP93_102410 [Aneurinibacillus soli]BAU27346.1 hypothetical protein CB4_01520 [Aneurinibacillus soli]
MQYLYLHRLQEQGTARYVYVFDEHALSPNNLVLRNLFRCMIEAVEGEIDQIEMEYSDTATAKLMGVERAVQMLTLMGAQEADKVENWQGDVLLSRTFVVTAEAKRLEYLRHMRELDEVYRIQLSENGVEKVHLYFAQTLACLLTAEQEDVFVSLLAQRNVPYKILGN